MPMNGKPIQFVTVIEDNDAVDFAEKIQEFTHKHNVEKVCYSIGLDDNGEQIRSAMIFYNTDQE